MLVMPVTTQTCTKCIQIRKYLKWVLYVFGLCFFNVVYFVFLGRFLIFDDLLVPGSYVPSVHHVP
jgi:hypothetical protein